MSNVLSQAQEVEGHRKPFDHEWALTAAEYANNISAAEARYFETKHAVLSREADRETEWKYMEIISCMISAYYKHGNISSADMKHCEESAGNGKFKIRVQSLTRINTQLKPFPLLQETAHFESTCNQPIPAAF